MARGVASLYVLTYKSGQIGGWDLHKEYPELATAKYNQQFLGEDAVRLLYSASDCGLALSRVEGAMWAAMEYMLCGLPVVSTRSFGGRDQFRDDYYWRTVASSPEAVAAGVRAWRKNPPDRQEVRRRVLAKVEEARSRFAQLVIALAGHKEPESVFLHRVWGDTSGISKIRVAPTDVDTV
jgi:glycosyltransferase involved in cell wall biosynthesis